LAKDENEHLGQAPSKEQALGFLGQAKTAAYAADEGSMQQGITKLCQNFGTMGEPNRPVFLAEKSELKVKEGRSLIIGNSRGTYLHIPQKVLFMGVKGSDKNTRRKRKGVGRIE